jgi:hypothetical protein
LGNDDQRGILVEKEIIQIFKNRARKEVYVATRILGKIRKNEKHKSLRQVAQPKHIKEEFLLPISLFSPSSASSPIF